MNRENQFNRNIRFRLYENNSRGVWAVRERHENINTVLWRILYTRVLPESIFTIHVCIFRYVNRQGFARKRNMPG